ncbi:MAG TPA: DUF1338 domain-containing protein [Myxococcales bacterium]|jgi:hypothetical protein
MTAPLDLVLDGLMARYRAHVPDVDAIVKALIKEGAIGSAADIENDHIAFRTLGVPHLGLASLERVFLHLGYVRRDRFHFAEKKLDAHWYQPPTERHPRVFISELRVGELSTDGQRAVREYTNTVRADPVDGLDLEDPKAIVSFLHRPLWRTPTWTDYSTLLKESEYAAWAIHNRYYLNHYTIAVHGLPQGFGTLPEFNAFLERHGFHLNDSGGKIKSDPSGKLLQSSTVAALVDADFDDGKGGTVTRRIGGSYVEFAERKVLDEFAHLPPEQIRREHRREGFEAANADRIFESTFTAQTQRRLG